jgi:FkbM family methyltransferase
MDPKVLAYRFVPKPFINELRHRKHLRDLATAVEPEESAVRPLILAGQTVLDIGANFGVFTKLFSQLVGPNGSVIAFEPVPQTFRTLAAGVKRFHLRNVQAINKAVSDQVGGALMEVPQYAKSEGDNLYAAHIVSAKNSEDTFSVNTVTIDSLQLSRVDFIKIDVEGHELEVLRGSRETLERYHPILMVEVTSRRPVEFLCREIGYEQPIIASPSNQLFTRARSEGMSARV